ncbi:MAG: dTDP-4-dehydrorhamnose 3,5-epimerase family protein [Candidatus Magasanikbacteria bacterium]
MIEHISGVYGTSIDGVVIKKIEAIPDERGAIYHMLRSDETLFEKFGEIYFSKAYPGVIKGWHLHKEMTLNYSVVMGLIKLVLYDDRPESPTKGGVMEIFMGEDNRMLIKIPPHVWNGYKTIGTQSSILANCATLPHTPGEMERLDPLHNNIPYSWDVVYK